VLFGRPGWRPDDLGGPIAIPEVEAGTFRKYDPEVPTPIRRYAAAQFLLVLVASVAILRFAEELRPVELAAAAFYITLSLSNLGSLLESARWVTVVEIARLVTLILTAGVLLAVPRFPPAAVMAAGGLGVLSLLWFGTITLLRGSPLRPSDGLTV
jgi:hypothetical protein